MTPAMPVTPDGVGEEQIFAGDGPAFDDAAHEITGLSCGQLDDLIVLGKCDTSSDRDKGLELEPPWKDGRAARAVLRTALPPPGPVASAAAPRPGGQTSTDAAVDAVPTTPPSCCRANVTNGGKAGVNAAGLRPSVPGSSGAALSPQRRLKKSSETVVNAPGLGPSVMFGSLMQRGCNKQPMAGVDMAGIGTGVLVTSQWLERLRHQYVG